MSVRVWRQFACILTAILIAVLPAVSLAVDLGASPAKKAEPSRSSRYFEGTITTTIEFNCRFFRRCVASGGFVGSGDLNSDFGFPNPDIIMDKGEIDIGKGNNTSIGPDLAIKPDHQAPDYQMITASTYDEALAELAKTVDPVTGHWGQAEAVWTPTGYKVKTLKNGTVQITQVSGTLATQMHLPDWNPPKNCFSSWTNMMGALTAHEQHHIDILSTFPAKLKKALAGLGPKKNEAAAAAAVKQIILDAWAAVAADSKLFDLLSNHGGLAYGGFEAIVLDPC